jgi:hypothetical protein
MQVATFNDVVLASQQGTITQVSLGKVTYGTDTISSHVRRSFDESWIFLLYSFGVFVLGVLLLKRSFDRMSDSNSSFLNYFSEPLVPSNGVAT